MARPLPVRYPRGGSTQWLGDGPAAVALRASFFGTDGAAAAASIIGAALEAQAGALEAVGAGLAPSPSAGVQSAAGVLSGVGQGIATLAGTAATTQFGALIATGGGAIPVVLNGGGPRRQERPRFLGELLPRKPKLRVAAAATLQSAQAAAQAGRISALGAKVARIAIVGCGASLKTEAVKAAGMARVSIRAAVIGARPVVVALHGASARVHKNEMKAAGLGFSDAELAAIFSAYDQAA